MHFETQQYADSSLETQIAMPWSLLALNGRCEPHSHVVILDYINVHEVVQIGSVSHNAEFM